MTSPSNPVKVKITKDKYISKLGVNESDICGHRMPVHGLE